MTAYAIMFMILGIATVITATIKPYLDGCRDQSDFILWLMNQPLENIFNLQTMIIGGLFMIFCGGFLFYV